jgi:hypothetical protein
MVAKRVGAVGGGTWELVQATTEATFDLAPWGGN